MSVSKKFSTLILYKGSWSDTHITSFQHNQPVLVPFLARRARNTEIRRPDAASTRAHKPILALTKTTCCSSKTETIPGHLLFRSTILPLFFHPSPSKPSLHLLLPPHPSTYTHCLLLYLKVTSRWLDAACGLTALSHRSQSHETKGNLAKFGNFLFWKECMFMQKSWILFNLILIATRENNGQWLCCCWWCWWSWFFFHFTQQSWLLVHGIISISSLPGTRWYS